MSLHNTAKKPTREEFRKKMKTERKKVEDEYSKLLTKLEKLQHENHVYPEDSKVSISGGLFSDFINNIGENKDMLIRIEGLLIGSLDTISYLLNQNAKLTLELMKVHINNMETGVTQVQNPSEKTE